MNEHVKIAVAGNLQLPAQFCSSDQTENKKKQGFQSQICTLGGDSPQCPALETFRTVIYVPFNVPALLQQLKVRYFSPWIAQH